MAIIQDTKLLYMFLLSSITHDELGMNYIYMPIWLSNVHTSRMLKDTRNI